MLINYKNLLYLRYPKYIPNGTVVIIKKTYSRIALTLGAASKLNRRSPAGRRRLRAVVFCSTAVGDRRLSFEAAPGPLGKVTTPQLQILEIQKSRCDMDDVVHVHVRIL